VKATACLTDFKKNASPVTDGAKAWPKIPVAKKNIKQGSHRNREFFSRFQHRNATNRFEMQRYAKVVNRDCMDAKGKRRMSVCASWLGKPKFFQKLGFCMSSQT
jgi:hypothetical protein